MSQYYLHKVRRLFFGGFYYISRDYPPTETEVLEWEQLEFEEESSIELFSRYGFRANFFKEFMEQNANKSGTNDISTSVLCSLKAGQTRKGSRYLQKRLRFFNHGFVEKIPRDRINEK